MIIIFISSLVLLTLLLSVKFFELHYNKKTILTKKIRQGDLPIKKFFIHLKKEISYLNWRNLVLLSIYIYNILHKRVIIIKRSFDSRQPRFLIASSPEALSQKNNKKPSNFLKIIGEHKQDKGKRK
ncbi:MAG: hypothetical protein WAV11_00625 [Minisyncoccia bacterium]